MSRIENFYTACHRVTKNLTPTLPGFQGLKRCIQHMASHPHKHIFILLITMIDQMSSDLHVVRNMLKTTQPIIVYNSTKMRIMQYF